MACMTGIVHHISGRRHHPIADDVRAPGAAANYNIRIGTVHTSSNSSVVFEVLSVINPGH